VLFAWAQPVAGSQLSVVHTLASSQLTGEPAHVPLTQTSPVVQAFASEHAAVLLVCTHPPTGSQLSVVQGLLSLQFAAAPA
jgi:hypothetical protein